MNTQNQPSPPPSQPPSQPPQNPYPPPGTPYPINQYDEDSSVMTTGQWLITFLIFAIPCVNIIMMFVWAFGNGNPNRRNYARALLIIAGVVFALSLLVSML